MSKVKGCWVAFDQDLREENIENLLNAIRHIKHVSAVEVDNCVVDSSDWMDRDRLRRDVAEVSHTVLYALITGSSQFCYDKPKTIKALQKIIDDLKDEGRR